jgi:23S rRNA pseudouridine2605 synthase
VEIRGEQSFGITLTEGKKHQIRRMVVALHNEVDELKRVRIGNIRLGKLHIGEYRPIEGDELTTFLTSLGLRSAT